MFWRWLGNFPLIRPLASPPDQNKPFEKVLTWRWRHIQPIVSRVKIGSWSKKMINNRYHSDNFPLIRPLASLPDQIKCFEKVWRDDVTVTMASQSAYCLSRENSFKDETNDKQQILLGNFPLIRTLAPLPVQNKCFEKVWRDDDVTVTKLSLAWK